jgi:hypothetical protein
VNLAFLSIFLSTLICCLFGELTGKFKARAIDLGSLISSKAIKNKLVKGNKFNEYLSQLHQYFAKGKLSFQQIQQVQGAVLLVTMNRCLPEMLYPVFIETICIDGRA